MTLPTLTLADFLLARIAEDEAVAQAATPSPWVRHDQGWVDSHGEWIIVAPYHELDITDEDAEHVTRWQPARVLAECETKRRIVEAHRDGDTDPYATGWVLCCLALPYADHPEYRDEWRP